MAEVRCWLLDRFPESCARCVLGTVPPDAALPADAGAWLAYVAGEVNPHRATLGLPALVCAEDPRCRANLEWAMPLPDDPRTWRTPLGARP